MAAAGDSDRRREIQSSLESIVESSEKWLGHLRRREFRVRLATAFLTTILGFFAVGASYLGLVLLVQGWPGLTALFNSRNEAAALAAGVFLVGVFCGALTYFLLKRRHEAQLKTLSSLIIEMKKIQNEEQKNETGGGGQGITEPALTLAEKIVTLVPEIVRKRNQDSLIFGVAAFLFTFIFSGNAGAAIVVGVIVWLYFRYEFRKTYEQEISKLEEQKRTFEQRKKDFLENL